MYVRSSLEHTDFFARLCDVDSRGRSLNVTDALLRVRPGRPSREADGTLRLAFELWPTACRFRRGHRPRLPPPTAGVQWGSPAVGAQPRQRRAAGHRPLTAGGRAGCPPRPGSPFGADRVRLAALSGDPPVAGSRGGEEA